MINRIDQTLAQQIVDTVKDVCGQDINFIQPSGIILASTNSRRIGAFHEIGRQAAKTQSPIEVESDQDFSGTQKGINVPIYYNKSILAVIGISGEPLEVRKYAYLAERISNLLIREHELSATSRNEADKKQFIIDSLIRKESVNHEYLKDCLSGFHMDDKTEKRIILLKIDSRYNPINLAFLEQTIQNLFEQNHLDIYTFHYPSEYLALADADVYHQLAGALQKFASKQREILKITVGRSTSLFQIADSYQSAITAMNSIASTEESFALYDDLSLEIILSDVKVNNRDAFCKKTIDNLDENELHLLQIYFDNDMSLAQTSKQLFLHKNTLQYKLNHIYQKCGLNPRAFRDATLLYLAMKIS